MLIATLLLSLSGALPDEGQGPANSAARLADLDAGRYVFGTKFEPDEHRGEVVLVVFGGS